MTKKLIPLHDNVIVKPIEEEQKTKSGIVIPETASKEKPMRGKVLSVGPGKFDENGKRLPIDVKEGDTVIFTKYSPTEIKIDNEELYVLGADSLLAIEK
ncbi:co-chaperone GroES [Candidatus Gracilibacteria bacterium]|nr:co-chaperone GroES [Candidatus Gracilibacteria bacterium]MCF7819801.1 co-chaperone GroES [Candidatus Gracilibacteria bacterium]